MTKEHKELVEALTTGNQDMLSKGEIMSQRAKAAKAITELSAKVEGMGKDKERLLQGLDYVITMLNRNQTRIDIVHHIQDVLNNTAMSTQQPKKSE